MANSKIYLGSTNIGSLFQGASDISIYLGENKVYPLAEPSFKWKATYQDSHVESAECDSSSEIAYREINGTGLSSVEIGDCVTSIGEEAFLECYSLTSITVNATTPPTLGAGAFNSTNNCPIYVPCESVEAYKSASGWSDYASRIACVQPPFEGKFKATYSDGREYDLACDGNTTLTTGNTRTNDYTLSAMTEAIIGDYCVTSIGDYAFKGCISLTSATIGSGVTSIGQEAFTMTKITSLTLPNSITNIKGWAFYGCSGLTSITVEAITPPTLGNSAFNNTNNCPIYVPSASVNAYKTASGWSTYADRIQAIP